MHVVRDLSKDLKTKFGGIFESVRNHLHLLFPVKEEDSSILAHSRMIELPFVCHCHNSFTLFQFFIKLFPAKQVNILFFFLKF